MLHFRAALLSLILCALIFSACGANATAEVLFIQDIDSIAYDIQVMYDEVRPRLLSAPEYDPNIYIAFVDIDFDGIPEFFYGYQTITAIQGKIWYRAYSISNRAIITSEHTSIPSGDSPGWNTYIRDDTDCAFFTGPDNFIEGYYLNDEAEPCFVTKARTGPATGTWTDYVFMEYTNSILSISTGFECDKELQAIKQVWSPATLANVKDDIIDLLNKY